MLANEDPQEASPGGFLARHGELVRSGRCCLSISIQPFAYVVANYICHDGDKKCEKKLQCYHLLPAGKSRQHLQHITHLYIFLQAFT